MIMRARVLAIRIIRCCFDARLGLPLTRSIDQSQAIAKDYSCQLHDYLALGARREASQAPHDWSHQLLARDRSSRISEPGNMNLPDNHKLPWMKFYPSDWRADPALRMCSLAARGLWVELIGYMHEGSPYGYLTINGVGPRIKDIAALVGRPVSETRKAIAELEARHVFSREAMQGTIYSRRMVRDK